jgi:enoyl-CoA hydratase/carnithine racemase
MVSHLVGLVGPSNAHLILMSGDRFSAAEALRMGLINKLVPAEELDAAVGKLTAQLAINAPLSLLANKRTVRAVQERDPDMAAIDAASAACFDSADYAEGRRAFMEKRKPVFTGR